MLDRPHDNKQHIVNMTWKRLAIAWSASLAVPSRLRTSTFRICYVQETACLSREKFACGGRNRRGRDFCSSLLRDGLCRTTSFSWPDQQGCLSRFRTHHVIVNLIQKTFFISRAKRVAPAPAFPRAPPPSRHLYYAICASILATSKRCQDEIKYIAKCSVQIREGQYITNGV